MNRMRTITAAGLLMMAVALTVFGQAGNGAAAEKDKKEGWLGKRGISLETAYIGEFWANARGGRATSQTVLHNIDISASLDTKRFGLWNNGKLFIHMLSNQGGIPLSKDIVGDSQTVSNIEAPHATRLYELWYEHLLFDGRLSLLVGIHDLNSEFDVAENGSLFINSSFGISKDISGAARPGIYPLAAPGIRAKLIPNRSWELFLGVYNGDPGDPEVHRHFPRFVFDPHGGVFIDFEAIYHYSRETLPGTIKIGYWENTGRFEDVLDADSAGNPMSRRGNRGFYFVADKTLTAKEDGRGFGAFLQLGSAPDGDINEFDSYVGGGLKYRGLIPHRHNDEAGIAVAHARLSDELVAGSGRDKAETTLEITYNVVINEHFALQPDIQFVFNPGADSSLKNAVVIGARLEVTF